MVVPVEERLTPQELFDKNLPLVKNVMRKVRGKYKMDPDDLFQELCILFWNCCQRFDYEQDVAFPTYVGASLDRRVWNIIQQHTLVITPRVEDWKMFYELMSRMESTSEAYQHPTVGAKFCDEEAANREWLREKLNSIKGRDGEIVRMFIYERYNGQEIGDRFGISRTTVQNVVDRWLNRLFKVDRKKQRKEKKDARRNRNAA